ncbi:MAG: MlaD family protein, partial [Gammaproteobacteria bacterium]|nr:MlaD family protein [Gammaproteobacteria bacterium]
RYTVFFERDISGLTLGAPVRYLGVGVGEVLDISLAKRNGTQVRVDVEVLESTPVTAATYAGLAFQGVTGVAFISLAMDPEMKPDAIAADEVEYPVIPTRDTGLAALLSDGPEISRKITQLLDRANQLLDEGNQDKLAQSLDNIERLTESLAGQENAMASLPGQLQSVLGDIEITLAQLRDVLDQASPDLLATMDRLNEASTDLADISARLNSWLLDNDRSMQEFFDGGLGQTPELIADARNTMRELEKLLAELRENPSQLVYEPKIAPVVVDP